MPFDRSSTSSKAIHSRQPEVVHHRFHHVPLVLPGIYVAVGLVFCVSARSSARFGTSWWLIAIHLLPFVFISRLTLFAILSKVWHPMLWAIAFLLLIRSLAPLHTIRITSQTIALFVFLLCSLLTVGNIAHRFSTDTWFHCLRRAGLAPRSAVLLIYPFILLNLFSEAAGEIVDAERIRRGGRIPVWTRLEVLTRCAVPLFYWVLLRAEEALLTTASRGLYEVKVGNCVNLRITAADWFLLATMIFIVGVNIYVAVPYHLRLAK